MSEKSIFKGGKKELLELKEILLRYYEFEKKIGEIAKKEAKQLQFNEERKREIEQSIIDRENELRKEVEKPYDINISKYLSRKEELLEHKEEKRKAAMELYIEQEKDDINHDSNHQKKAIRKIAEERGVPAICTSKLFLALFYPKVLSDAIVLIISLVVLLLVFPFSIFYLFFPEGGRLELTTVYLFIIVLIFAIYALINTTIKEKYALAFKKINDYRVDADNTAKEIREIIQKAKEMSDEELVCDVFTEDYLQSAKEELESIDMAIMEETAKKDVAVRAFDENTEAKAEREKKFREMYQKEMKRRADMITDIQHTKQIEEQNLAIIEQLLLKFRPLEQYGIDIFNEQMLDELLGYLRSREAKTIGGAIELRNKIKIQ